MDQLPRGMKPGKAFSLMFAEHLVTIAQQAYRPMDKARLLQSGGVGVLDVV